MSPSNRNDLIETIERYLASACHYHPFRMMKNEAFWQDLLEATKSLPETHRPDQRYWHLVNDITKANPGCALCGADVRWLRSVHTYSETCSCKCHRSHKSDQIAATNTERYGGRSPAHSPAIIKRMSETMLTRFGVDNISKSAATKARKVESAMRKYGVTNVSLASEVRAKISAYQASLTDIDRERIFKKKTESGIKRRPYTMPSGAIALIQGWEDRALDILVKDYTEDDIIVDCLEIPIISYNDGTKNRFHLPDIFIRSENRIIEVKSQFTYQSFEARNICKQEAAINLGYTYEFWIFNKAGDLTVEKGGARPLPLFSHASS